MQLQKTWIVSQQCIYVLANKRNGTLYIRVTSDLRKRVWEHKHDLVDGFTKRYRIHMLVWYELCSDMAGAIMREKQLKKWNRKWKLQLIAQSNPEWKDLWLDII